MKIRAAIAGELETLREVRNLAAQAGCRYVYSPEQLRLWLSRPLPEKMLGLLSEGHVLVAEQGNDIVGYGALDPKNSEIEAVFVLPSCVGHGVGRALLAALESRASALNLAKLQLSASLNAVSFYRNAGYVCSGRGEFPLNESMVLDYENMEKHLGAAV